MTGDRDDLVYVGGLTFVASVVAFFAAVEEWALAAVTAGCLVFVGVAWVFDRRRRS